MSDAYLRSSQRQYAQGLLSAETFLAILRRGGAWPIWDWMAGNIGFYDLPLREQVAIFEERWPIDIGELAERLAYRTDLAAEGVAKFNGVTLECRIGEIGWPTQGFQASQPHPQLATATNAKWHYDAVSSWLGSKGVKAYLFEAIDEPWKGNQSGTSSEAFFGKMMADGSTASPGSYALRGIKTKY